jgi:hypothetical protein
MTSAARSRDTASSLRLQRLQEFIVVYFLHYAASYFGAVVSQALRIHAIIVEGEAQHKQFIFLAQ